MFMRRLVIIMLFIFANSKILLAENINLEVYLSIEQSEKASLSVDGMDVGKMPAVINDLPVGRHNFKIKLESDDGKVYTCSYNIDIPQKCNRIYLPISKEVLSQWKPFLYGIIGGTTGFWTFIILMMSLE